MDLHFRNTPKNKMAIRKKPVILATKFQFSLIMQVFCLVKDFFIFKKTGNSLLEGLHWNKYIFL